MVEGAPRPDLLTHRDREEINGNIVKNVLDSDRFGEILLQSSSVEKEESHYRVRGKLTLHGITKEISFPVRRDDHSFVVEVRLYLPDFGIRPFSALFGAIRIKPDILIRVEVPADLLSTDFLN
jgi:polyisoprenoid-binding protein YceI